MTIAGMPALAPSTPRREAWRAALTGLASGAGAALWLLGAAASSAPPAPLGAFAYAQPAIAPRDWVLDHRAWHGVAGLPSRMAAAHLALPSRILGMALIALAALAVLYPGALRRAAPLYLSPARRAGAWIAAILFGWLAPAALGALIAALAPDLVNRLTMDAGAAFRLGIVIAVLCAAAWTAAGPGVVNLRAALRLSHGALAGISIWGALALAVLLAGALTDLAQLATVGNVLVAVDAGARAPGATYGWTVEHMLLLYGLAFALAGALATASAPQSMGPLPRTGSAAVAGVALLLLLLAGHHVSAGAVRREALAAPDVRDLTGAPLIARPRPVVLLMGDRFGRRRVPPRQALAAVALEPDCAPTTAAGGPPPPAAGDSNLAVIDAARTLLGDEVSGRAARLLGCEAAIRARLFDPVGTRRLVLVDGAPARVGFFAFAWVVRGLLERPVGRETRYWLRTLADTSRYTLTPETRDRIARILQAPEEAGGTVTGALDVEHPERWRAALIVGDTGGGIVPWLYAPRTDGLAIQYMQAAATPDARGAFTFPDVPPGIWQLALLAPEGTDPVFLSALSIRGDPGQFIVPAASRRDLGTIRIRP